MRYTGIAGFAAKKGRGPSKMTYLLRSTTALIPVFSVIATAGALLAPNQAIARTATSADTASSVSNVCLNDALELCPIDLGAIGDTPPPVMTDLSTSRIGRSLPTDGGNGAQLFTVTPDGDYIYDNGQTITLPLVLNKPVTVFRAIGNDSIQNGQITETGGSRAVRKTGASILSFRCQSVGCANNSYSGGTTIAEGTLGWDRDGAFGAAGTAITIENGATLLFEGSSFSTSRPITLAGGSATITARTGVGATVNGAISGPGRLIIGSPAFTSGVVLNGNNSYQGGTTVASGALSVSSDANLGASGTGVSIGDNARFFYRASFTTDRPFTLNGNSTISLDSPFNSQITGIVGGSGSLIKTGTGTLVLANNNTYAGTTSINGTLQIGNGGTTGTLGGGAVTNNGTLIFNRSNDLTVTNTITSSGAIIKDGAGTLTLAGQQPSTGNTTINAGTLVFGGTVGYAGGGALTINGGNLTLSADATFRSVAQNAGAGTIALGGNRLSVANGDYTLASGSITGGGTIALLGNSRSLSITSVAASIAPNVTITSTGVSNRVVISGPGGNYTLQAAITGSGAPSSPGSMILGINNPGFTTTISGNNKHQAGTVLLAGTLAIGSDTALGTGSLFLSANTFLTSIGLRSVANPVALNGSGISITNTDTSNMFTLGGVIRGTNGFAKTGAGTLTLTEANTYEGATTISAGTLQIGNGGTSGSLGTGNVTNNAALAFNRSDNFAVANLIGGTGNLLKLGTGTTTLSSAVTQGSATVQAGTLVLRGANTFTNGITVSGGTLSLEGGNAAGGATSIIRTTGSVISYSNGIVMATPIQLNSNTTQLQVLSGQAFQSGMISEIGGARPLEKIGDGALVLSAANSYTGLTTISGGTLRVGLANALTSSSGIHVAASGAVLDINGFNQSYASLTGVAGSIVTNGAVAPVTLTLGVGNSSTTFGGRITNGTGALSLVKTGTGTLTLSADNSYTGVTTVANGTLIIGTALGLGTTFGPTVVQSGATLAVNATGSIRVDENLTLTGTGVGGLGALRVTGGSIALGGVIQLGADALITTDAATTLSLQAGSLEGLGRALTVGGNGSFNIQNSITGLSSFTKTGSGTTSLLGRLTAGQININQGVFRAQQATGFGGVPAVTVNSGATLQLVTTQQIGSLAGGGTVTFDPPVGTNPLPRLITGDANTSTEFSGVLTGAGRLFKTGTGTFTLTGENSYTGTTTISGGTLQIGNGGTTGALATAEVFNNATLAFNRSNDMTFSNVVSGTGSLTKLGAGRLILTGANTYSGTTTVSAGTLQIGSGGTTGTLGSGAVTNNATLTFNRSDNITVNNAITGTGALVQSGAGNLTISSNLDLGGTLTVNAGTLTLTGTNRFTQSATINGALALQNGGTLSNTAGSLGLFVGQSGTATVTGTGSRWTLDQTVTVGGAGTGGLTVSAGGSVIANAVGSSGFQIAASVGGQGTVLVTGAGSRLVTASQPVIGWRGTGEFTIADGGFASSNGALIGSSLGAGGTALVTGTGSRWETDGQIQVGRNGEGSLTIANGGIVRATFTTPDFPSSILGLTAGSRGTVVVTGAGSRFENIGSLVIGRESTGVLTISQGGAVEAGGGVIMVSRPVSTGTLNFGAAEGSVAVAAGTLITPTITFGGINGTGTGTIVFNHTSTDFALASAISGTGAIRHIAGTTNLSGNNGSFAGTTAVTGGTLLVSGTLGGNVTVTGGTLGGRGRIAGGVTIGSGGTLAAGQSPGTMTVDALMLNAGSLTTFELAQSGVVGGANNDLVRVNGQLALNGGNIGIVRNTGFSAGQYTLFEFGSLSGALGNLTLNPLGGGFSGSLALGTGTVLLNVATANDQVHWNGSTTTQTGSIVGGSGTWNLSSGNFSDAAGTVSGPWQGNGSLVNFGGTAGTVTIEAGTTVAPVGLDFLTNGYVITGGNAASRLQLNGPTGISTATGVSATIAAIVSGTGSVTKTGTGTLTLSGVNSYSGGTTIAAGRVRVGADANLGAIAGGVSIGNGVLGSTATFSSARSVSLVGAAEIDVATGTSLTLTGALSGTGSLAKTGNGQLLLTANNNYAGSTSVTGGGLLVGSGGTTGSLGAGNILNGGTILFNRSNDFTVGNVISGGGNLVKEGSGIMTLTGANSFAGGVGVTGGTLVLASASAGVINAGGTGFLSVGGGSTLRSDVSGTLANNFSFRSGGGTIAAATGTTVRLASADFRFEPPTGSPLNFGTATATGTIELAPLSVTLGAAVNPIAINGGTLRLSNANAVTLLNGSSGVTLNGATLGVDVVGTLTKPLMIGGLGGTIDVASASLTLQGDTTFTGGLTKTGTGELRLTGAGTGNGIVQLNAGTLALVGNTGGWGTGALQMATGTNLLIDIPIFNTLNNNIALGAGAGSTILSRNTALSGNISGGALNIGALEGGNFLVLGGNNAYGATNLAAGARLQVGIGGTTGTLGTGIATLGTGSVLSFVHSNNQTVSNVITGTGVVQKALENTLVLTGNNTATDRFTGTVFVRAGTLLVNGNLGDVTARAATVTALSGATLGGIGTISGNVSVNSGGILSPGRSAGTLTIEGNLTLRDTSILNFELDQAGVVGGGINDLIRVGGNLTLDGTLNITALPGFGAGFYRLFDYGGTLTNNQLTMGTTPLGFTSSILTDIAGQVNVLFSAGAQTVQYWDGADTSGATASINGEGGAGSWSSTSTSWTTTTGFSVNNAWAGQVGIFAGAAGGIVNVTGTQAFQELRFQTNGYTLNPIGPTGSLATTGGFSMINVDTGITTRLNTPISGTAGLTKTGAGVLALAGANTYSGLTTVTSGTLSLLSSGVIAGAVQNNATFINAGTTTGLLTNAGTLISAGTLAGGLVNNAGATANLANTVGGAINNSGTITLTAGLSSSPALTQNTGGTFNLAGFSATLASMSGTGAVQMGSGTLTTGTDNRSTSFDGVISGSGTFNKAGTGTLTLGGSNTAQSNFTGTVNVNSGTLLINGQFGDTVANAANLTVANGATLGGSGTFLGNLSLGAGGNFASGNSPSTLNIGRNLLLDATSVLNFKLAQAGTVGGGINDLITVGGNLTLDGTLNVAALTGFGDGIYRLFNYGGTLTDNGLLFGLRPDGFTASLITSVAGQVSVQLTRGVPTLLYWDGTDTTAASNAINGNGGSGTWNTTTTNWTSAPGFSASFAWGSQAGVFAGVAGGTVQISGTQAFQQLRFDTNGYQLNTAAGGGGLGTTGEFSIIDVSPTIGATINAGISGTAGLTKTGTGTLTLGGANSFAGLTTVNGGTLALGAGGSLAGAVQNDATFTNAGSVAGLVTNTGALTSSGTLNGGLVNNAAATANIAGTLNGAVTNSGTVTLTGATTGIGAFTQNAGGVFNLAGFSTSIGSLSGTGSVQLGSGTLTSGSNNASTSFTGVISGSGGVTKTGTGTLTLSGVNSFTGLTTITAGALNVSTGASLAGAVQNNATFTNAGSVAGLVTNTGALTSSGTLNGGLVNNAAATANIAGTLNGAVTNSGTITLTGATTGIGAFTQNTGGVFNLAGFSTSIGSLSGTGSVQLGSGTLTTGGNNASTSFAGVISGSGGLSKTGSGTLTLSGANSYTGLTTVSAGTLALASGGSLAGAVQNNASFTNAGTVAGLVTNAGTLTSTGTLNGGLVNNAAATANIAGTLNGAVTNSGTITLTGATTGIGAFTQNTGGVLNLAGFSTSIGSLSGTGSVNLGSATLTTGSNNASTSFAGVISGSGGLTKAGTGTLTLSGVNSFTGQTTVSAGTLVLASGGSLAGSVRNLTTVINAGTLAGSVINNGALTSTGAITNLLVNDTAATANLSGVMQGSVINRGNINLTGTTTGIGEVVMSAGSNFALLGNNTSFGSLAGGGGTVALGSATLTLGSANLSQTYDGTITGIGSVIKTGTGTLSLSAAQSYAGVTTVSSGGLILGHNGSLAGAVQNNAIFTNAGTVAGLITNAGVLMSSGTLNGGLVNNTAAIANISGTLNGAVTNSGTITLTGATTGIGAFTQNAGGVFNLAGFNTSIGSLSGTGAVQLGSGTLTSGGNNASTSFAGVISGSGGLTKSGSGTFTLSGANSYTGLTTVSAGTLALASGGSLAGAVQNNASFTNAGTVAGAITNAGTLVSTGTLGGALTNAAGANAQLAGQLNNSIANAGTITLTGTTTGISAVTQDATGVFDLGGFNTSIGSLSGNGAVQLGSGTLTSGGNSASTSFAGVISGNGGLSKTGTGTLTLSGANTYAGATTVSTGTLNIQNAAALGTAAGATTVLGGAALELLGNITVTGEALTINGTGLSGGGALRNVSGNNIWAGTVNLGSDASIVTVAGRLDIGLLAGSTQNLTIAGAGLTGLSGASTSGTLTVVEGSTALFGSGNFASGVTVNGGALFLQGGTSIDDSAAVTVNNGGLIVAASETIGSIAGTGGTVQLDAGQTLTLGGNNASTSYAGQVFNTGNLVKQGTGTFTVTGTLAHTGTTSINGGTLLSGAANIWQGNGLVAVATGGTLDLGGFDQSIANIALTGGTLTNGALTGAITSSGGIINAITGTANSLITTAGTTTLTGAGSFALGVTLNGGDLALRGSGASIDDLAAVTVNTGVLSLGASETIGSLAGSGGSVQLGNATLITGGNNANTGFAGVISGNGALTKTGTGTFTLSGVNSYTGLTTVSAGTLALATGGTIAGAVQNNAGFSNAGSVAGLVTNAATLSSTGTLAGGLVNSAGAVANLAGQVNGTVANSGAITLTGATTGIGAFTQNSGGTFNLAGFNTSIGSLSGNGAVQLGSATLTTGSNNASTGFAGSIAGNGGLTKTGTGVFTLSGANSYTGQTSINAGTLALTTGAAISGAVQNNATFSNAGTVAGLVTNAGTLVSTGALSGGLNNAAGANAAIAGQVNGTVTNAGTITITGTTTGIGALTQSGTGTLNLAGFSTTLGSLTGSGSVQLGTGVLTTGGDNANTGFAGIISGTGSLTKTGTGTFTLSGTNSYTGLTTVSAGTLALATGGAIAGAVQNNAGFSNAGSVAGLVTNAGTLISTGSLNAGLVNSGNAGLSGVLTGAVSNSGVVQLQGGLTGIGAFSQTAAGTFDLAGFSTSIGSLAGAGLVQLGSATLTTGSNGGSTSFAGLISGTGGLTKVGAGTFTLTAGHSFTGLTTVTGGTLAITATGGLTGSVLNNATFASSGIILGGLTNNATALLAGQINGPITNNGTITGTGDSLFLGRFTQAVTGSFNLAGFNGQIGSLAGSGSIQLGSGFITVGADNGTSTFAGVIGGSGGLVKIGSGTFTLSGVNSYTGTTLVTAGTLVIGAGTSPAAPVTTATIGAASASPSPATATAPQPDAVAQTPSDAKPVAIAAAVVVTPQEGAPLTRTDMLNPGDVQGGGRTPASLTSSATGIGMVAGVSSGPERVDLFADPATDTSPATSISVAAPVLAEGIVATAGTITTPAASAAGRLGMISGLGNGLAMASLNDDGVATASLGDDPIALVQAATLITGADNAAQAGPLSTAVIAGNVVNRAIVINNGTIRGQLSNAAGATTTNNGVIGGTVFNEGLLVSTGTLSGGLSNQGTARIQGVLTGDVFNAGTITLTGTTTGIAVFQQAATGSLTLGGFDTTLGVLSGAGTIALGSARLTTGTNGAASLFSGVISGSGGLTKTGTGGLILTGDNLYTGGTTISAGVLQLGDGGTTGSILGPITNNGTLIVNRSNAYTLANTISGTGLFVQAGTGTTTLTGVNSYTGGTLISAGRLVGSTTSLQGVIQNDAALEFAQAVNGVFAGRIGGTGLLDKTGAGLLELTGDNSGLRGATTVRAGELRVTGALSGSATTVLSGATLSGTGTLGGLIARSGSIVSPGNGAAGTAGIGMLGVNGSIQLQSGSTLRLQTHAVSGSDMVIGNGTVQIAGTAAISNLGGTYAFNSNYLLLQTSGGRTGTFESITGLGDFGILYRPELVYTGTQVLLRMAPNLLTNIVGTSALTANQRSVVSRIDAAVTAGYNPQPLFNVYSLPTAQLVGAFDQLSGEIYATAAGVGIEQERLVREAVLGRIGAVASASREAPEYGTGAGAWAQLFGSWGDGDGNGNTSRFESDRQGFITGIDYGNANSEGSWRIGAYGLHMTSRVSVDRLGSRAEVEQTGGGIYAGINSLGFSVATGVAVTGVDLIGVRNITLPGFAENNRGRGNGQALQGFAELSYTIDSGSATFRPFISGAAGSFKLDALNETGGAAALAVRRQSYTSGSITGGLDGTIRMGKVNLSGTLAGRAQLGDRDPQAQIALAAAPAQAFSVRGVQLDSFAMAARLDATFKLGRNADLSVGYTGLIGNNTTDHGARANLSIRF